MAAHGVPGPPGTSTIQVNRAAVERAVEPTPHYRSFGASMGLEAVMNFCWLENGAILGRGARAAL